MTAGLLPPAVGSFLFFCLRSSLPQSYFSFSVLFMFRTPRTNNAVNPSESGEVDQIDSPPSRLLLPLSLSLPASSMDFSFQQNTQLNLIFCSAKMVTTATTIRIRTRIR
ncbi:hypothetical protein BDW69DRAFT_173083 [Aspergillus filifer]